MSRDPKREPKFSTERSAAAGTRPAPERYQFLKSQDEDPAETMRLKAALKRAVAKADAPAYLIEAIRERIRE